MVQKAAKTVFIFVCAGYLRPMFTAQIGLTRYFRSGFDRIAGASCNPWNTQAVTIACVKSSLIISSGFGAPGSHPPAGDIDAGDACGRGVARA